MPLFLHRAPPRWPGARQGRQGATAARDAANAAFKERNDILRELAAVQAQLAGLTERAAYQAQTIADIPAQVRALKEEIRGKAA